MGTNIDGDHDCKLNNNNNRNSNDDKVGDDYRFDRTQSSQIQHATLNLISNNDNEHNYGINDINEHRQVIDDNHVGHYDRPSCLKFNNKNSDNDNYNLIENYNKYYQSDHYSNIIREILDSESLNSIRSYSSLASSNNYNDNRISNSNNTPTSDESVITIIDDGEVDDNDVQCNDIYCEKNYNNVTKFDNYTNNFDKKIKINNNISNRKQSKWKKIKNHLNIYDYCHRFTRYIYFIDILFIFALFLSTLIILLLFRPHFSLKNLTTENIILFIIIWSILSSIYLSIPTFKRWFYYWNPDFHLTRPS